MPFVGASLVFASPATCGRLPPLGECCEVLSPRLDVDEEEFSMALRKLQQNGGDDHHVLLVNRFTARILPADLLLALHEDLDLADEVEVGVHRCRAWGVAREKNCGKLLYQDPDRDLVLAEGGNVSRGELRDRNWGCGRDQKASATVLHAVDAWSGPEVAADPVAPRMDVTGDTPIRTADEHESSSELGMLGKVGCLEGSKHSGLL